MSSEVERTETASPVVPGEEADQPNEMSKSQVASASPGKLCQNAIKYITYNAKNAKVVENIVCM